MGSTVVIARTAQEQVKKLSARWRSTLKQAMREHLQTRPAAESRSRIKRLKRLRQPQYRLRVDEMRVFNDLNEDEKRVEVLGFVQKSETLKWLQDHGVPE
jgi:mRNA interferase RelE/StbE